MKYRRCNYDVKVIIGAADILFELWFNGRKLSKDNPMPVEWSNTPAPPLDANFISASDLPAISNSRSVGGTMPIDDIPESTARDISPILSNASVPSPTLYDPQQHIPPRDFSRNSVTNISPASNSTTLHGTPNNVAVNPHQVHELPQGPYYVQALPGNPMTLPELPPNMIPVTLQEMPTVRSPLGMQPQQFVQQSQYFAQQQPQYTQHGYYQQPQYHQGSVSQMTFHELPSEARLSEQPGQQVHEVNNPPLRYSRS